MQLPLIEQYVTIACVSNEVGGDLVGNAKWTGVRLADVLEMAGVQPGATQVVPRSVDGWTAGFPTAWLTDPAHPREAMIAVKMNDQPLPAEHGFPARLIVPGLYGYVSATKWLAELELTTLEAFDAYWVPRGWAKEAPILTQSRIDVPNGNVQAGDRPGRRRGVGARSRHLEGRGLRRRRRLAAGDARDRDRAADVGPVEVGLAGGARQPRARGPRDRRHGRDPDVPGIAAAARWRPRLPPDRRPGRLIRSRPAARAVRARPMGRRSPRPASGTLSIGMTRRRYLFDTPDRFVAGTVGEPGNRAFFLQARDGTRVTSVALEKVQVAALIQRLDELLDELERRGIEGAGTLETFDADPAPLDEPINEAFRAGTLSLGWDTQDDLVLLEAREQTEDEEEDEEFDDDADDGPDLLRVRITPLAARAFVGRALRVLAAGRPPCPLCGQPLDPQGHLCPRRNGHRLN